MARARLRGSRSRQGLHTRDSDVTEADETLNNPSTRGWSPGGGTHRAPVCPSRCKSSRRRRGPVCLSRVDSAAGAPRSCHEMEIPAGTGSRTPR
eukprot:2877070-Prymnesium_polylepis.2